MILLKSSLYQKTSGANSKLVSHKKNEFSSGIVEGFNCKAKLTIRKAYGFRTFDALEIVIFHQLGALPEPEFTHSYFWGGKTINLK